MNYNKITLSFSENDERLFSKEYFLNSIIQFRIAFVLVIFLYGVFGYLDKIVVPEYANAFHIIRYYIVTPLLLIVLFLSFFSFFQKVWQYLLFISFIVSGAGISVMTMFAPDNYAYYAGLMLVFFAGYFFIKLRFFWAAIAGWTVLVIYNIGAIFYANTSLLLLINNNFFFSSANLIGMFAAYNIEYYARRNFYLNQILKTEKSHVIAVNKNLEAKVEERTKELLNAKEEAENTKQLFKSLIENAPDGVVIISESGKFVYGSPNVYRHFGYNENEVLGKYGNIFTHPEDMPLIYQAFETIIDNPLQKPKVNYRFIHKDGEYRWIEATFTNMLYDSAINGIILNFADVTERRQIVEDLIKAKDKAEESDRLKSAFLANMSHEIRTPMNGILGFADLLKEQGLSGEEQRDYIAIIEKSGRRMLNIINQIIDISKIEAGLIKLDIGESNINEQIEYIYTFFKSDVEAKGLKLLFKNPLPATEAVIKTDREKLYAILTNLVKNAIKYTHEGAIEFGYDLVVETHGSSSLQFYVKDSGIGIPQDRQSAIFERFIQADIADKMAYQGAGLGLAITKAYVEMLGGKIWVESKEGIGSTFYFTLPYITEPVAETIDRQSASSITNNEVRKLKILFAEDDEVSEKLIDITLRMIGRDILKARSGVEAVEACRNNPDLDLILMDIRMPEMSGYEAVQQIRGFNKEVIIIAQTAHGLSGDREKAIESGCNDYIAKPVKNNELQALIRKYFGK